MHSFETAGQERFAAAPEGEDATRGLARAIDACLPLPGPQERDWTLWVELWLRAVRDEAIDQLDAFVRIVRITSVACGSLEQSESPHVPHRLFERDAIDDFPAAADTNGA